MDERKIDYTLGGKTHQVFAGNAALIRYRNAGGDMAILDTVEGSDSEGGRLNALADRLSQYANLIHVNLVGEPDLTVDDILNGSTMEYIAERVNEIINGIPWLKNEVAIGDNEASTNGRSRSQSSDGNPTRILKSAAASSP